LAQGPENEEKDIVYKISI